MTEHVDVGHVVDNPLPRNPTIAVGFEHGVIEDGAHFDVGIEDRSELRRCGRPVEVTTLGEQREAGGVFGSLVIDGKPGAIRAASAHLVQHERSEATELGPMFLGFQEQSDDSAHGSPKGSVSESSALEFAVRKASSPRVVDKISDRNRLQGEI